MPSMFALPSKRRDPKTLLDRLAGAPIGAAVNHAADSHSEAMDRIAYAAELLAAGVLAYLLYRMIMDVAQ